MFDFKNLKDIAILLVTTGMISFIGWSLHVRDRLNRLEDHNLNTNKDVESLTVRQQAMETATQQIQLTLATINESIRHMASSLDRVIVNKETK